MAHGTAARLGWISGILFALLRFLIPLGGILGLVWVLVVSALLLIGSGGRSARGDSRRLDRSA